jgi:hypothetical protein
MSIQKGVSRTITFGSLTTAGAANTSTTPTTVVDKDGGGQNATTNSPTHQGNGSWKITLTSGEMTADLVSFTATGTGLVPTYRELYTEADYTTARAVKLDDLDAAISTRSTYAGGDTSGVTTLLGRIPGTIPANGSSFTALGDSRLANLDAAVSTRSTYAGADTSGTTTLLSRLTSTRAGNLDNLDAAISTRSTYAGGAVASVTNPVTVGTNNDKTGYGLTSGERTTLAGVILSDTTDTLGADILAIKAKTDNLPATPADETLVINATTAIFNRIGAPVGASISADIAGISEGSDPWATDLPGSYGQGTAGYIVGKGLGGFYAASVSASMLQLDPADPRIGTNLAGFQLTIFTTGNGSGQSALIAASNVSTNVQTLTSAGWSLGITPTGTVGYDLYAPSLDKAGYALSAAGLDQIQVEAGCNARQALSPILAAAAGVITGDAGGTPVVKAPGTSGPIRISSTIDPVSGDRTSTTLHLPT